MTSSDLLAQARQHLALKKIAPAIDCCLQILESEPHHEQALLTLAAIAAGQRDAASIERYSLKLLEAIPHQFVAYFFLGHAARLRGEHAKALEYYETACALNPADDTFFRFWLETATHLQKTDSYKTGADLVFVTASVLDNLGFNPDTPKEKALGGSESALIAMALKMSQRGHRVAVYCNCNKPGNYDGVIYRSNHEFAVANRLEEPKLLVVSRYDRFLEPPTRAGKKIFWAHDHAQTPLYNTSNRGHIPFDTLFALSRYHLVPWQQAYNLPSDKIFLTRNGFDPEIFKPGAVKREQIIFTSRFSRGLHEALLVFEKLKKLRPNLELAVCTYTKMARLEDDPEMAPFLERLQAPGIRFLRGLGKKELAQEIASSLFMLYPNTSFLETSCLAAIEAMACGCPVVTSSRGALAETVQDGEGGLVVPITENQADLVSLLTEASLKLLNNQELRQNLSGAARARAVNLYTWDRIADEWETFFKQEGNS